MAEIVQVYRQEVPAMRFIGKRYGDGGHWGEWFANDWFSTIENAMGGEQAVHRLYEDGDAYIGLRRWKEGEPFEYWIGEFTAPGTPVPDGFLYRDYPPSALGVCWISGTEESVYSLVDACAGKLAEAGLEILRDEDGAVWAFERCGCPRFTTPDEQGNIILDFCHFVR